ncbi:unnamed protein product [Phytophthora fragariaefolia]|uniref:Unnamed protein product n=1 Tax=Phytophthora fragariaefolia TaxID=1490495 RepID=A0A9W6YGY4_9STRA|nr:unnamed protein product [Phytophthora fragariaefolia]
MSVGSITPGMNLMAVNQTRGPKADPRYESPFKVARVNAGSAYILQDQTGSSWSLKPVFAPQHDESPRSLVVKSILNHRGGPNARQCLVRWAGFPDESDSWEPPPQFDDVENVVNFQRKSMSPHINDCTSGRPADGVAFRVKFARRAPAERQRLMADHAAYLDGRREEDADFCGSKDGAGTSEAGPRLDEAATGPGTDATAAADIRPDEAATGPGTDATAAVDTRPPAVASRVSRATLRPASGPPRRPPVGKHVAYPGLKQKAVRAAAKTKQKAKVDPKKAEAKKANAEKKAATAKMRGLGKKRRRRSSGDAAKEKEDEAAEEAAAAEEDDHVEESESEEEEI